MKIINFLLFIVFFSMELFASNIKLKSQDYFLKGEPFIFEYEAVGGSVKFPKIDKIDKYIVEDLGTSRSLQIINGNYSEKLSKRYKIIPQDDFTIPSFTFNINGKEIKSESKKIVSKKINKTISNDFDLLLKASKENLYVGEDFVVTLVFKYKRGLQITNLNFENPHFENFWQKKIEHSSKRYEENGYIVQELKFLLFPQKSGNLEITPLHVDVQLMDEQSQMGAFGFFSTVPKTKKVYSNSLKFNVKSLPQNVSLIGKFDISAKVDKTLINQGESISYQLKIVGNGNFDDIPEFKINVPNAIVYDNKPVIKTKYTKNAYEGTYTKTFSIVPNSSTVIPKFSITYFDKINKQIVKKETKSFKIDVKNVVEKKVVLEKELSSKPEKIISKKVVKDTSLKEKILYFSLGIAFTLLIIGLFYLVKINSTSKRKKSDTPLIKQVKKVKSKQELLKILIPFVKKDDSLDRLIFDCESEKSLKFLKKELIILLKELKF